jgi:hypothetical protein
MALLTALMATLLLMALGAGLTLTATTETMIAINHRDGVQTLYAAESGIELAISGLRATADWTRVARGAPLVQGVVVDSRVNVIVSASADTNGDPDVLVLQSSATMTSGVRRSVQVTVRRLPMDATGVRAIETTSWR